MEVWKSVQGYEGLYEVSNMGNIRRDGRMLKPYKRKRDGYLVVTLSKDGVRTNQKVHRLVALAFIPNPNNLTEINHKDENKQNNSENNLEWCRHEANCNYGSRNQRIAKRNARAVEQIYNGAVIKTWPSAQEAGRFGYTRCSVIQCCNGKARSHKGYQWRWKENEAST